MLSLDKLQVNSKNMDHGLKSNVGIERVIAIPPPPHKKRTLRFRQSFNTQSHDSVLIK